MRTPHNPDAERVALIRADMQHYRAACGCELGSVFTLIATVGFLGYALTGHAAGWSAAGTLGRGLLWVVSMSLVGKLLGLAYARLRLLQLGRELRGSRPHSLAIGPSARPGTE